PTEGDSLGVGHKVLSALYCEREPGSIPDRLLPGKENPWTMRPTLNKGWEPPSLLRARKTGPGAGEAVLDGRWAVARPGHQLALLGFCPLPFRCVVGRPTQPGGRRSR